MTQTGVKTYPKTALQWEEKRIEALLAIGDFIHSKKVAPTYDEIGVALSVTSQTARTLVNALCALGWLTRIPGGLRSISVTRVGKARIVAAKQQVAA